MKKPVTGDEAYRKFVTVWQTAETLDKAAMRLRMLPRKASVTASFLRRRGVKLKCFPRGKTVDYAELKTLALQQVK